MGTLSTFGMFHYQPPTGDEITRYIMSEYPSWLKIVEERLRSLHQKLEARNEWPTFLVMVRNTGTRPATQTLMRIEARGQIAVLHRERKDPRGASFEGAAPSKLPKRLMLPLPPEPPRGTETPFSLDMLLEVIGPPKGTPLPSPFSQTIREPDKFHWRKGKQDWGNVMELECANWRHGQEERSFLLRVRPSEMIDSSGLIEVSVHADNISDPVLVRLPIRLVAQQGDTVAEARSNLALLEFHAQAEGRF
jgi:hypothetical protein